MLPVQNVRDMAAPTREAFASFAEQAGGDRVFQVRLARHFADFYEPLARLYGKDPRFEDGLDAVAAAMAEAYAAREERLRQLDYEREITPDWFQRRARRATSRTPIASPARSPACASGCRTSASSASATCT